MSTTRRVFEPTDLDLVALEEAEARALPRTPGDRSLPTVDEALALAGAAGAPRRSFVYHGAKRATDVVLAAALLVVSAPIMAVLVVLVKLDSRGPALFCHRRVGKGGQLFRFYKFRTMHSDARERFPDLYAYDYREEELETMYFKLPYDPRLTRVGRWLRRTSLDELPNLFNVIKGDMTLVGPRPEIPEMLPFYRPDQYCKFAVKPGVTGLAQVSGRNILRFVETNETDAKYVAMRSLRADFEILIETARTVWARVGAL